MHIWIGRFEANVKEELGSSQLVFELLKADHIIIISEFSKKDIFENYGISENKITVAYPEFDENVFKPKHTYKHYTTSEKLN